MDVSEKAVADLKLKLAEFRNSLPPEEQKALDLLLGKELPEVAGHYLPDFPAPAEVAGHLSIPPGAIPPGAIPPGAIPPAPEEKP